MEKVTDMKQHNKKVLCVWSAAAVLASLLAGCAVGPDYRAPDASSAPASFKEAAPEGWKSASPADSELKGEWWRMYGDPVLNDLEARVVSGNQTVAQYVASFEKAAALVSEYEASLYPAVNAGASGSRSRQSGRTGNSVSLTASLSWELDLWGKLRRQVTEEKALAQAAEADLANAALSAQASLARNYFTLRSLDERIALYEETIRSYESNVRVLQNKYRSGAVVKSDLTQAEQSLYSARSSKASLEAERAQYEHAIAVLTGRAPAEFSLPASASALPAVPAVPAGVPSRLLERRPDIASAERSMAAANEEIGIAIAGYYPDLTLTGETGYSGSRLSHFVNAPHFLWSLGASAAAPLFDAGKTSSRVRQAKADYEKSVASYRETVLEAFQGVEDYLAAARLLEREIEQSERGLQAAAETARVKSSQYAEGMIDYTDVYTSETTRLSSQQNLISLKADALVNSVRLIEALGGGWEGLGKARER